MTIPIILSVILFIAVVGLVISLRTIVRNQRLLDKEYFKEYSPEDFYENDDDYLRNLRE